MSSLFYLDAIGDDMSNNRLLNVNEESNSLKNSRDAAENNPCSICRVYKLPPPCKGHGGKKGSSGGGSGKENTKEDAHRVAQANNIAGELVNVAIDTLDNKNFSESSQLINKMLFNPNIISELLSAQLLFIDNNRELGILSIRCTPWLLSENQKNELKKFIDVLLNELPTNCILIEKDSKGDLTSLRITLPTPTIYDAFIKQLVNKNLLPAQNIEQKEKPVYECGVNHFIPTPFSTKLSPSKTSAKKIEEEEEIYQVGKRSIYRS